MWRYSVFLLTDHMHLGLLCRNKDEFRAEMGDMTFRNLHGKEVTFSGPNNAQPYKRALAFHVRNKIQYLTYWSLLTFSSGKACSRRSLHQIPRWVPPGELQLWLFLGVQWKGGSRQDVAAWGWQLKDEHGSWISILVYEHRSKISLVHLFYSLSRKFIP